MTDIAAVMGIAGLESFAKQLDHRRKLFFKYEEEFKNIPGIRFVNSNDKDFYHGAWLSTVIVENRVGLQKKLIEHDIESSQVHYRNDRYKIFSKFKKIIFPLWINMRINIWFYHYIQKLKKKMLKKLVT